MTEVISYYRIVGLLMFSLENPDKVFSFVVSCWMARLVSSSCFNFVLFCPRTCVDLMFRPCFLLLSEKNFDKLVLRFTVVMAGACWKFFHPKPPLRTCLLVYCSRQTFRNQLSYFCGIIVGFMLKSCQPVCRLFESFVIVFTRGIVILCFRVDCFRVHSNLDSNLKQ